MSATKTDKHLRRICPALIVSDAQKSAEYYRDKLGFDLIMCEDREFAIVARDGCQIFLKRSMSDASRTRNRDVSDNREFYDPFIHCDNDEAFESLAAEFETSQPDRMQRLGADEVWGSMSEFSVYDLDG